MTMTNCTLKNNAAIAGSGGTTSSTLPLGLGLGGGLDMWWFSIASIIDSTFMGNQAMGGFGGAGVPGGRGMGGRISVGTNALLGFPDDSSLTISNSTIADNLAQGGAGANGGDGLGGGVVVIGQALGGGLYIDVGATVTATRTRIQKNSASTDGNDLFRDAELTLRARRPTLRPLCAADS